MVLSFFFTQIEFCLLSIYLVNFYSHEKTDKIAKIAHCVETEADEGKSILLDDSSSSLLGNTWALYLISTLDPTFELISSFFNMVAKNETPSSKFPSKSYS